MRAGGVLALAALAAATAPRPAHAGDELALRAEVDAPLLLGSGLVYLLTEQVMQDALAPDACRWCGDDALDRAARDALRWDDPAAAATASDWIGHLAVPALALGGLGAAGAIDHRGGGWLTDGVIVLESAFLASDVTNVVKSLAGRERPFVHALAPADKPGTASPAENNLSFFSGHSSQAMAFAVSAGTVASLRGYRAAPAIWVGGVGLALTTGYLRVAADKHWATDVVAGWAVGAAVGFAVPYYLHRPHASARATVGARSVALTFAW